MGEFYRGGRRTYGFVLLIISGVLLAGWLRSRVVSDELTLEYTCARLIRDERSLIRSHDNVIRLIYRVSYSDGRVREQEDLAIPYATVTLPLAIVSACLILWPSKRPERPTKPQLEKSATQ
jgi:hypothetical protein